MGLKGMGVCARACVCMYPPKHVCAYPLKHACAYPLKRACVHSHARVRACVHVCACMCVCVCVCVCARARRSLPATKEGPAARACMHSLMRACSVFAHVRVHMRMRARFYACCPGGPAARACMHCLKHACMCLCGCAHAFMPVVQGGRAGDGHVCACACACMHVFVLVLVLVHGRL